MFMMSPSTVCTSCWSWNFVGLFGYLDVSVLMARFWSTAVAFNFAFCPRLLCVCAWIFAWMSDMCLWAAFDKCFCTPARRIGLQCVHG